jgi:uncharacterized protein (TIRG00374 family)
VTAVALYWTLHDVAPGELLGALSGANSWLILAMLPFHVIVLWLRAIRWRYLSQSIAPAPLPMGALFRATAVGFMALNLLPLRIGELIRPWFLAKETNVRASAALGTIVIERAIDFTSVAIIGGVVLFFHTSALPTWVRTGATLFVALSAIPFAITLAIRIEEQRTLRLAARALSFLPERAAERVLDVLAQLARGLGSMRSWKDVAAVFLYSLLIWLVFIPFPFALGLFAFGIDLSPQQMLLAVYTTLVFTALAIAAPAAPGFFGVYHFACREALALFGVSAAVAVGYGTIVHLVYWGPVTLVGLICVLRSGLNLAQIATPSFGKARVEAHR